MLAGHIHGLGFVNRRDLADVQPRRFERAHGRLQHRLAVAHVRSQAQVDLFHSLKTARDDHRESAAESENIRTPHPWPPARAACGSGSRAESDTARRLLRWYRPPRKWMRQ